MQLEVATLNGINENKSREYAASQNELQLRQQSLSEQHDIVTALRNENDRLMDRQKFSEVSSTHRFVYFVLQNKKSFRD